MLEKFFIYKKEFGKYKIKPSKPFELTPEKIAQNPRSFNTSEIKIATENLQIVEQDECLSEKLIKLSKYIFNGFFFQMHQSGLYNRQLKLWKNIGNINQVVFYKIEKGIIKKKETNIFFVDFLTSSKSIVMRAIIPENNITDFKEFKTYLLASLSNSGDIKGIFHFTNKELSNDFQGALDQVVDTSDQISKYESKLIGTNEIRLNIIKYKNDGNDYSFEHIYPKIESKRPQNKNLKETNA